MLKLISQKKQLPSKETLPAHLLSVAKSSELCALSSNMLTSGSDY